MTTASKEKFNLDVVITEKLIAAINEALEGKKGAPWQSPYLAGGLAMSMSTGKPYRGINPFLLVFEAADKGYSSKWWGTYKHITERGGQVRKGEEATMIVWWKRLIVKAKDENGKPMFKDGKPVAKTIPMLRYFKVFNADQADWENGIPTKFKATERNKDFDPIAEADAIVMEYLEHGPTLQHLDQGLAWYMPALDIVNVPNPENIKGTDAYYSTLFHELSHSTGHKTRLNRDGVNTAGSHKRGTVYSFEELVAEFGAALLCSHSGVKDTIDNSVAYLQSWARFLTEDKTAAVKAATQAQKAVDVILGTTFDNEGE